VSVLFLSTMMDKGAMPGTSYNRGVPNTAFRPIGTAAQRGPLQSSQGKFGQAPASRSGLGTAAGYAGAGEARPMTSVSSAGYKGSTNKGDKGGGVFDPLNIGRGPAPPLAEKADNSHEDKAKEMEKNVHRLIEASAKALAIDKDYQKALDKAKEAGWFTSLLC
jgi:intraflagellar transport protein 88